MREPKIDQILSKAKTIAVVGYSGNPARPSNEVANFLHARGYKVIAVNPGLAGQDAFGRKVVASLAEIDEPVDMVDVFRRSEETPDIASQAVAIGAKVLWLQLGVISDQARMIAEAGGLQVVMDRCPIIELGRG